VKQAGRSVEGVLEVMGRKISTKRQVAVKTFVCLRPYSTLVSSRSIAATVAVVVGLLAQTPVGILSTASVVVAQHAGPRTPGGHPDFQGTYEFATLTPLQRPKEFATKPFLTEAEAAEYVRRRNEARHADRRSPDPLTDLLGSYNEFWYERPRAMLNMRGRHLTSRIVDPPDGRVPGLTPAAQQRLVASAKDRQGRGPANGPEDLDLPTRCLSPSPVISPGGENGILQIVQTADHVAIHVELISVLRIVSLGRPMHLCHDEYPAWGTG
jgi:hypothetical protein